MVENDNKNLLNDNRHGNAKIQIVPVQTKTLQHLPKRPAVDLAFHDLTYRVREGGRNTCVGKHLRLTSRTLGYLYQNIVCVAEGLGNNDTILPIFGNRLHRGYRALPNIKPISLYNLKSNNNLVQKSSLAVVFEHLKIIKKRKK
uniref:Uncharacterized protein n=1 Tax=Glossina pallidipes TaxID=7398 RepID=A0A1A9ZJ14_GLOPL